MHEIGTENRSIRYSKRTELIMHEHDSARAGHRHVAKAGQGLGYTVYGMVWSAVPLPLPYPCLCPARALPISCILN